MDDLISRKAMREAMYHEAMEKDSNEQKWDGGCWIRYKMFERVIESLPSAEKTGKWIIKTINTFELAYGATGYEPVYECSECGCVEESYLRLDEPIMPEDADFPRYCPNCGARMVEE